MVVKTPSGDVKARAIPAGNLELQAQGRTVRVDVAAGAEAIMKAVDGCGKLDNVTGEAGTNIGGMLEHVRQTMAELTNKPSSEVFIQDLLAVDTSVPVSVTGGLAGEFSLEQAVGIASMVKSDRLQMAMIAREIEQKLNIDVQIGGAEAEAAILGALTTPGTTRPLAILDLGAGSTDASIINPKGKIIATHLAGAGDMVTMIIARELGLEDRYLAEEIKKYPLAKVESLFHLRHEDGSVQFFPTPLPPAVFARVCVVKPDELVPLPGDLALEKVRAIRRSAKERVFVTNALRAASGQSNRQHSRYSVRGAGRRLVAGFRSSSVGHRCAGALPPGRRAGKYSRQRRPKKRGSHRPDSLLAQGVCAWTVITAPRLSSLPLSTTAPASGTKCCWVSKRKASLSCFSIIQLEMSLTAPGRRRVAHRCWLALPAIDTRWSYITRIYPHRRRFLR